MIRIFYPKDYFIIKIIAQAIVLATIDIRNFSPGVNGARTCTLEFSPVVIKKIRPFRPGVVIWQQSYCRLWVKYTVIVKIAFFGY